MKGDILGKYIICQIELKAIKKKSWTRGIGSDRAGLVAAEV